MLVYFVGVKAPPKAWSHWDTKKLQPRSMSKEKETDKKKVVLMKEGKVNKDGKEHFMDGFLKTIM